MSEAKQKVSSHSSLNSDGTTEEKLVNRRSALRIFGIGLGATAGISGAQAQAPTPQQVAAADMAPLSIGTRIGKAPSRFRPAFEKDIGRLVDLDGFNQGAAYWNLDTYITPIEKFYIRNGYNTPRAADEPRVDPQHWKLRIHGDGIERPLTITYDDLLKMPSRSLICTMECAGNGRTLFWEQQDMLNDPTKVTGSGWGLGGIGQAEWQYVPMSHILSLVGLKKTAKQVLFWSGVDNKAGKAGVDGDSGRPMTVQAMQDLQDVMGLAFKMNGQPLPSDHGAPVRAIVPGYCGAASTKWLTEIKISTHNFWVRLNTRQHVMIGPDYPPPKPEAGDEFRGIAAKDILGQAVTWNQPKSLLAMPLVLEKQPKFPHNYPLKPGEWPRLAAGSRTMKGFAWAPRYGVRKVEYRIDAGEWTRARIELPNMGRFTWVRFDFPWEAATGRHLVETRVTDRRGNEQPDAVPYNQGGFNFWAVPKFHVNVV